MKNKRTRTIYSWKKSFTKQIESEFCSYY